MVIWVSSCKTRVCLTVAQLMPIWGSSCKACIGITVTQVSRGHLHIDLELLICDLFLVSCCDTNDDLGCPKQDMSSSCLNSGGVDSDRYHLQVGSGPSDLFLVSSSDANGNQGSFTQDVSSSWLGGRASSKWLLSMLFRGCWQLIGLFSVQWQPP